MLSALTAAPHKPLTSPAPPHTLWLPPAVPLAASPGPSAPASSMTLTHGQMLPMRSWRPRAWTSRLTSTGALAVLSQTANSMPLAGAVACWSACCAWHPRATPACFNRLRLCDAHPAAALHLLAGCTCCPPASAAGWAWATWAATAPSPAAPGFMRTPGPPPRLSCTSWGTTCTWAMPPA